MAITKSNKHKLSLDRDKPNEKGGCTLATPYALMRSLILDYQISIAPLGSCTPFALQRCFSAEQMSKRNELDEQEKHLYPHYQTYPLESNSAYFWVTRCAGQCDRTRPVGTLRRQLKQPTVRVTRLITESGPP
jgi:hypothetical protein